MYFEMSKQQRLSDGILGREGNKKKFFINDVQINDFFKYYLKIVEVTIAIDYQSIFSM